MDHKTIQDISSTYGQASSSFTMSDTDNSPPSYTPAPSGQASSFTPNESPPAYDIDIPTQTFTIRMQKTKSLVEPKALRGHLGLLRLFHLLRSVIEEGADLRLPQNLRELEESGQERRWVWFLSLAVERCGDCRPSYPSIFLRNLGLASSGGVKPLGQMTCWSPFQTASRQSM